MKKIILTLLLFISLFALVSNANNSQWSKVNKYIYIDKSSITKNNGVASAWFKIYNSSDNSYELIEYKAYCDSKVLEISHMKTYDAQDNLLSDEINDKNISFSLFLLLIKPF